MKRGVDLRPYRAGVVLDRFHRAYALGYSLAPLTGLNAQRVFDFGNWASGGGMAG